MVSVSLLHLPRERDHVIPRASASPRWCCAGNGKRVNSPDISAYLRSTTTGQRNADSIGTLNIYYLHKLSCRAFYDYTVIAVYTIVLTFTVSLFSDLFTSCLFTQDCGPHISSTKQPIFPLSFRILYVLSDTHS